MVPPWDQERGAHTHVANKCMDAQQSAFEPQRTERPSVPDAKALAETTTKRIHEMGPAEIVRGPTAETKTTKH